MSPHSYTRNTIGVRIGHRDCVLSGTKKRLRLFREKAKNKRMGNPSLTAHDSLQDEVAYGLTKASLLKEVQSVVQVDKEKDGS